MSIVARGLGALRQLLVSWGLGRFSAVGVTVAAEARLEIDQVTAAGTLEQDEQDGQARLERDQVTAEAALEQDEQDAQVRLDVAAAGAAELAAIADATTAALQVAAAGSAELLADAAPGSAWMVYAASGAGTLEQDEQAAQARLELDQVTAAAALAA